LLGVQIVAVLATWIFAFIGALILLKLVDLVMGLRVEEEHEIVGLDLSQHDENAYALGMTGTSGFSAGMSVPRH